MASPEREYRQLRYAPPPGAARLLLIRHGESAPLRPDAPFPRVDGHGDPDLAAEGRVQAERLATRLASAPIAAIYVTTLRRTAQTAAPLAALIGLTPRVCADLREVYLGEWEGGGFRRLVGERHPTALRMWAEERWDVIPGAEPGADFAARVRRGVTDIARNHPDELVAVFTHGGVIGRALAEAAGSRPFAFVGADNASVSEVVIGPAGWQLRRYNDSAHLD